ncbi:MAG: response regulator transcription factor [Mycobacteriaceae bacterium]
MTAGPTDPPAGTGPSSHTTVSLSLCVLDHETALAEALAEALRRDPGVASALSAGDPRVAAWAVESRQVNALLVGIDSHVGDADCLIRWSTRRRPGIAVVVMSQSDEPRTICAALLAGAQSWVPKSLHLDELTGVLLAAARGESFLPPRTLARVLAEMARSAPRPESHSSLATLTERELDVLEYLALGLSRAEIADELALSVNTVRTHLQRLLAKLGVHTRLEAVSRLLLDQSAAPLGWPS